ncbi:MAG: SLC13 family permease [Planctomycetaceae bacterium]|nr:SLC13 family permease [Planctomycetaceae bacterium]
MPFPDWLHPWIAVAASLGVFVTLQLRRGVPTDLLFLIALLAVTLTGVLSPQEALAGFANPAPIAIAGLLMVAAGLRSSGALDWLGTRLLGTAHTERKALWRLTPTLLAASAFTLNTALVAMLMPVVIDWCRRHHISPSRLLLPLSYLVILGGVCTVIGTSTTLVVNGMLRDEQRHFQSGRAPITVSQSSSEKGTATDGAKWSAAFLERIRPIGLFELGRVGFPCALAGALVLLALAPRLLPNRTDIVEQMGEQRREYLVEMLVQPTCPLIGQTVEQAGLRHLPGLFLVEIDRGGDVLTPVAPRDPILAHDRLIFTGIVSTIVDLEKLPGLVSASHPAANDAITREQRRLTEVVLSRTSPLINTTVRAAQFRQRYNAAVMAVHRNGDRLTNKIGNILLEPGDTLLLQTGGDFVHTYRNSTDFYLVSSVEGTEPRRHHKLPIATGLSALGMLWLIAGAWLQNTPVGGLATPPIAALTIAALMVLTRCLRMAEARAALDLQVLLTIVAALGLGRALLQSGAAQGIARVLVDLVGAEHPYALLVVIFLLGLLLTETITNNAVAAMLLPIALAVAWAGQLDPRPFIIAITLAASLSFVTPIGYQTNLMVMGPGGYQPRDYLRCGLPLAVVVGLTAMLLVPWCWPLRPL